MTPGRFHAVGVGPGDPELLTRKAVRLVREADAVFHAGPQPDHGRALGVVREFLRPDQRIGTVLDAPMGEIDPGDWRPSYRPGVERILAECRQGHTAVFITEGDPTLYSTAAYVWQLLHELATEIPIEVVPGVSSVSAAAARDRRPLAQREEGFAVVPGSGRLDDLPLLLDRFATVAVLKPSAAGPEFANTLADADAVAFAELTTERELVTADARSALGRPAYFSLLLVRKAGSAQQPGSVRVIGVGPGDSALLTGQAVRALRDADIVIGFDGYLGVLGRLTAGKAVLPSPIGAEAERARTAVGLAAEGRRVALVSSGDAGVYGMASLLFETAAASPGIDIEVIPGVTAALSAAALLGAPLGHDFACISLSDLLTPWDVIEQRLDAAGRGDFVLAVYNPISQRRTWQLPRAREILLTRRAPVTPVGLVRRAFRPETAVWTTTLGGLTPDGITMETILIVGSSQTRLVNGRMVTPRGYTSQGVTP